MIFAPLMMAAALLAAAPVSAAHPGHGSEMLVGTLKAVAEDAITLEIRDSATLQLRRVKILVNEETKFRVGKDPIDSPETMVGTHAAVAVEYEEGPTGEVIYRATQIRFKKPKNKDKN